MGEIFSRMDPGDWPLLFRTLTLGRLMGGTIHNLNGPLQVLSMQIELLTMDWDTLQRELEETAKTQAARERLSDIRENLLRLRAPLSRIEGILSHLQARWTPGRADEAPITHLQELLANGVEFWRNDLFFKHEVEVELRLQEGVFLPYPSDMVCMLMDGAMGRAILALRRLGGGTLSIETVSSPGTVEIRLAWRGREGAEEVPPGPLERETVELGWNLALRLAQDEGLKLRGEGEGIHITFPLPI